MKSRSVLAVVLVAAVGVAAVCVLRPWGAKGPTENTAPAAGTQPVGRADPQTKLTVNWIGHWLDEDLRETLVREVAKEFAFSHPDIEVNLKFPQEILGQKAKPLSAKQYADMIRSGKISTTTSIASWPRNSAIPSGARSTWSISTRCPVSRRARRTSSSATRPTAT